MSGFVTLCIIVFKSARMTSIEFVKYHGTGNDFILIDNRTGKVVLDTEEIALMCHRRFGIGADGLMMLLSSAEYDFEMKYYNSDGREGSMCGNGGRCISAFAADLGIVNDVTRFSAIDGVHTARISHLADDTRQVVVSLNEVEEINRLRDPAFVLDTGSPHYVRFVQDLEGINVAQKGRSIRWDSRFAPGGVNVNFVQQTGKTLRVITFERGVEDITLSCGTGVTACALAASAELENGPHSWNISTAGGELEVSFVKNNGIYSDIWLKGPAERVFAGTRTR